ncbi:MAG: DUF2127 domain-containing protein [Phycisphaerae bacterium]|nr:DUF2127 domain-containing protein [Phycisphaerae bacterium]
MNNAPKDPAATVAPGAPAAGPGKSAPGKHRNRILLTIALFKLFKATVMVAAGVAAIVFRKTNLARVMIHWVNYLRLDPHNRFIDPIIDRLHLITPQTMEMIAGGTFFYAVMFAIEGFGLYFEKVWAEYLVLIDTAVLLPLEIYEITRKPDVVRIGILVGNVLILTYLIYLRIKAHRLKRAAINDKIQ